MTINTTITPYRVLVTGPRGHKDETLVHSCLWYAYGEATGMGRPLLVVHGHCPTGADRHADIWVARMRLDGHPVEAERHPAQNHPTEDFGPWPGAGPRRNRYMTSLGADVCYAFLTECPRTACTRPRPHDTHGTSDCAGAARAAGITVREIRQ